MAVQQRQHQQSLVGKKACNNYFKTTIFTAHPFQPKIPKTFADLIQINNRNDPLLQQVLPRANVVPSQKLSGFSPQPLADEKYSPTNGVIHKYPNRALLIVSSVCAIHCRYCFRQNFAYDKHDIFKNLPKVLLYLKSNTQINEVILSGGDPLSLNDKKLKILLAKLAKIKHLKTLRIHTRTAAVKPSRITVPLANLLKSHPQKVVIVLHINHPTELSPNFKRKIPLLTGTTLLNQSVLLAGVNDNSQTLIALSQQLFTLGILPYYLHQLDKVAGAEHFLVPDKKAQKLHQTLKNNLSGYLVPKLVRDNNNTAKDWL